MSPPIPFLNFNNLDDSNNIELDPEGSALACRPQGAHEKKIVITVANEEVIKFQLYNVSMKEANVLRRKLMNLPTISIDQVNMLVNISNYIDEFIVHRLGLIPICNQQSCSCDVEEGCDICQKTYELHIECSIDQPYINVMSSDLFNNKENNIIIAKLFPGQKLHFQAMTKKGTNNIHAKWNPFGVVYYKQVNNIIEFECELTGAISCDRIIDIINNHIF